MSDGPQVTIRTGAWHSDQPLTLAFPREWQVTTFWPSTPPPLSDRQISEALEHPVGQAPIGELCQGKKRPLVIVDDLTRPTPAGHIMPWLLRQFRRVGIPDASVTILLATGTHPAPASLGVAKKIGQEAATRCRVVVHDHRAKGVMLGRTSFRTPVIVDKEVPACDFVMGIGGVYPNYTAGFGGGSKLALGVLGTNSITHLHYKHGAAGWGMSGQGGTFRKDLDEIAQMMGLGTLIIVHANADCEPVRLVCGDAGLIYAESESASRQYYAAPPPNDADVVIANAYPEDLSLQFANMKGAKLLSQTAPGASRIVLASCHDGVGDHGLFPLLRPPSAFRSLVRIARAKTWRQIARGVLKKVRPSDHRRKPGPSRHPIWLYQIDPASMDLPAVPGMRIARSWEHILAAVAQEQNGKKHLRAVIYPCAPMQFFDPQAIALEVRELSASTAPGE